MITIAANHSDFCRKLISLLWSRYVFYANISLGLTTMFLSVVLGWKYDKTDNNKKTGAVYQIQCKSCKADYIGETARQVKEGIAEHRRPSMADKSPMAHHLQFNQHTLDNTNIKVLDRDNNWRKRGIREAIQIRTRTTELNRDEGRHRLSHAWDDILQLPAEHAQ